MIRVPEIKWYEKKRGKQIKEIKLPKEGGRTKIIKHLNEKLRPNVQERLTKVAYCHLYVQHA